MKKTISLFTILFHLTISASFAQFEGTIVYNIAMPETGGENSALMAAMLPSETMMLCGKNKIKMDMKMAMGMQNSTIVDKKSREVVTLMDIMGNKLAMKVKEEDVKDTEKPSFKLVTLDKGDKTTIAGHECKHAIYEDNQGGTFDVYYTDAYGKENISSSHQNPFKDIKGLMLKYTIVQKGLKMVMTAKSVVKEKIDEAKFVIPADYKLVTQEELGKMFGGMGN